jgi:hypothetical protein
VKGEIMKRGISIFLAMLLLVTTILPARVRATEGTGNGLTNSDYAYEISGKKIRRIDLSTGKVTVKKIKSRDKRAKVNSGSKVLDNGKYVYYVINTYGGSDTSWHSICRVKKNGTGFQVLDKGENIQIIDNRIYYSKTYFSAKKGATSKEYSGYTVGTYRMNLNGTGKTCLVDKKAFLCADDNGYLYVSGSDSKYDSVNQYDKTGTFIKKIVDHAEYFSIVDGKFYYGDYSGEKTYRYLYGVIDLETNEEKITKSKDMEFVAATERYLFFCNSSTDELFYCQTGQELDTLQTFQQKIHSPNLVSSTDNDYIVFSICDTNVWMRCNVVINIENNTVKRVSKKFTS